MRDVRCLTNSQVLAETLETLGNEETDVSDMLFYFL